MVWRMAPLSRGYSVAIISLFVVLLLMSDRLSTVECASRVLLNSNFHSMKSIKADGYRINDDGGVVVELFHRDHIRFKSSNSQTSSSTQRLAGAVRRSKTRLEILRQRLSGSSATSAHDYDSPSMEIRSPNGSLSVESPVFSQQAEYILRLSLGSPPQTFTAIADTGSDLVWVQCKPCLNCFNQTDPVFDFTLSTTFETVPCTSQTCRAFGGNFNSNSTCNSSSSSCDYQQVYGDGSFIEGVVSTETLSIGSTIGGILQLGSFAFGCGHHNVGNFAGADGLVGLGRGSTSFASQISPLVGNKFSHCFVTMNASETETSALIFGNASVPFNGGLHSKVKYTPMLQSPVNPSMYYVGLESVAVNDKKLNVSSEVFAMDKDGYGGTVVDSGTPLTFLNQIAFDALVLELNSTIVAYPRAYSPTIGLDLCYNVSGINQPTFPCISFGFIDNATYYLPTENAFVRLEDEIMCLAMAGTGPTVPGIPASFSLLGNIQQQNFQVIYDRDETRIGFRPHRCADFLH